MLNNILNEKRPHDFGKKLGYSCLGDTRSLIMFQCIIIKKIHRLGPGHNLKIGPQGPKSVQSGFLEERDCVIF